MRLAYQLARLSEIVQRSHQNRHVANFCIDVKEVTAIGQKPRLAGIAAQLDALTQAFVFLRWVYVRRRFCEASGSSHAHKGAREIDAEENDAVRVPCSAAECRCKLCYNNWRTALSV